MIEVIEILGASHEGKTNYILENYINSNCIYLTNEATREEIIKKLNGKFEFDNNKDMEFQTNLPIIDNVSCEFGLIQRYYLMSDQYNIFKKRILILDGFFDDKEEFECFKKDMYIQDKFDKIIYTTQVSRKLSAQREELKTK